MAPKTKFTQEEIIDAAFNIVRHSGISALTARSLAQALGTSTKPIFGLFPNMEAVQSQVLSAADRLYQSYLQTDMAAGIYPPYKASGMAYIRFAREEKELFKLLFMRSRVEEKVEENKEEIRPILEIIQKNLNISEDNAYLLHLELWLFVHGVATMAATDYLDWDLDFISDALTDVYQGLKHRFTEEN